MTFTRACYAATKKTPKARKPKLAPPSHQAAMQAAFELSRQLSLEVREEELIGTFASTMGVLLPGRYLCLRVVDPNKAFGVMRNKSVPIADERCHLIVRVWSYRSDRDVHDVDPGILETLEIGSAEGLGIGEPGWSFVAFDRRQHSDQGERIEHIHDRAALNQIDRAGGIFRCALREKLKPTAIEHWCGDGGRGNSNHPLEGLTSRNHTRVPR